MPLLLYAHPFSSYCQKALIALYENDTPFELRKLGRDQAETGTEFARLWPVQRMPLLVDGARTVMEATVIIEYLDLHHPGPVRLLPADPQDALEARLMDRCFDNYVMAPMQKLVFDSMRPADAHDTAGVHDAHGLLDTAYAWLDGVMAKRHWAAGSSFGLADCAAAPALFYADWVHPIPASCPQLAAYRRRLLDRPSFARAVDEARPYRGFFPPGAPDRD